MTMLSKFVAAAVLGSALIVAPAMAQNDKMSDSKSTAPAGQSATAAGLWQGSKLINMNVYNEQNEKIGTIKDLMLDKSGNGTIASVVIGVGGFLGMGERDVAVKWGEIKWSNEPVKTATSAGANTMRPATTGAGAGAASAPKTYPDHAVFNATKDQLKAMPQFDYNK
jgi:sporulation protein YlmC with PRC-barrel domain